MTLGTFPGPDAGRRHLGRSFLSALGLSFVMLSLFASSVAAAPPCGAGPQLNPTTLVVEGTDCADVIVVKSQTVKKIRGGGGNDVIFATDGVAEVYGEGGADRIYGEPFTSGSKLEQLRDSGRLPDEGRPVYTPAPAPPSAGDSASADSQATASEVMYGGAGNQTLVGGTGGDWLYGQRGNDHLWGQGGDDLLNGGPGDDTIIGEDGWDILGGGFGEDFLDGRNGSDMIRGDGTGDVIQDNGSAADVDTISYSTATAPGFVGTATNLTNFPPEWGERGVYLRLDAVPCSGEGEYEACNGDAAYGGGYDQVTSWQFENVIGSPFADVIVGNAWNNRIDGGGGADVIYGSAGDDVLVGGADGDFLQGEGGNDTAFGVGGFNNCWSDVETKVDCQGSGAEVRPRDANYISVGFQQNTIAPHSRSVQLYMVGSNTHDSVFVQQWWDSVTQKTYVSFHRQPDSWASFDTSAGAQTPGCNYSAEQVFCALPAMVDSIVLAGMVHDDGMSIHEGHLGEYTSTVLTGGTGSDAIWGSGSTEDVLIDGDANGGDWMQALGWDDVLLNNAGTDTLQGGNGNDLLLSTEVCAGDVLWGAREGEDDGAATNNASWAKMPGPAGVGADLATGWAGNGFTTAPTCSSGSLTRLLNMDDLEGSNQSDAFFGDNGANGILGRQGNDWLSGRGGADVMQAGSAGNPQGADHVQGDEGVDYCEFDGSDSVFTCP
jgi:Ca2+-binding RTX toxin-like protein